MAPLTGLNINQIVHYCVNDIFQIFHISEFAKEFCLDDLNMVKMESEDIANLPNILPSQTMAITTSGILEQKDCDLSDIETSDNEDSNSEYVGKENILSDKISIGANKQKQSKSNQVN